MKFALHEKARRLLDPEFPSKAPRLAAALRAMDTVVTVGWFRAGRNKSAPANLAAKRRRQARR